MEIRRDDKGKLYQVTTEGNDGINRYTILNLGDSWFLFQKGRDEPRLYKTRESFPIREGSSVLFDLDGDRSQLMLLDEITRIAQVSPSSTSYFRQSDPDLWIQAMDLHTMARIACRYLENYICPIGEHRYLTPAKLSEISDLAEFLKRHFEENATAPHLAKIAVLALAGLGVIKTQDMKKVDPDKLRVAIMRRADLLNQVVEAYPAAHNQATPKKLALKACHFCNQLRLAVPAWGKTRPESASAKQAEPATCPT